MVSVSIVIPNGSTSFFSRLFYTTFELLLFFLLLFVVVVVVVCRSRDFLVRIESIYLMQIFIWRARREREMKRRMKDDCTWGPVSFNCTIHTSYVYLLRESDANELFKAFMEISVRVK